MEYRGRLGKGISGSVSESAAAAAASRAGHSLDQEQGTDRAGIAGVQVTLAIRMPSPSDACAGSCWEDVTTAEARCGRS